jgi:hypothetical protein
MMYTEKAIQLMAEIENLDADEAEVQNSLSVVYSHICIHFSVQIFLDFGKAEI